MKILVVGNDKIGGRAVERLFKREDILCVVDKSSGLTRVLRLVWKRRLSLALVLKMLIAEACRSGKKPPSTCVSIASNHDLYRLISEVAPAEVVLFRAGLIVGRRVLDAGVRIVNLHCCRLPGYGGIGTIFRALQCRDYEQEATLHVVTTRIDEGEILSVLPFQLSPAISYAANEDVAYGAGIRLLSHYLDPPSPSGA
jgi:methionyl-tRNA formyltransferase